MVAIGSMPTFSTGWRIPRSSAFRFMVFSEVRVTARSLSWWRKMCLRTDTLQRRTPIDTQAKSDGLRLLRAIDATQAHGQEGTKVDPNRAAREAALEVSEVGSDRYHPRPGIPDRG